MIVHTQHASVRSAYEQLKRSLANQFPDRRSAYTAAKAALIEDVLARGHTLP